MNVGDIICGVYHYSSQFGMWYRITKTTSTSVYIEKLQKEVVSVNDKYSQSGKHMPVLEAEGIPIKKRFKVNQSKYGEYIDVNDVRCRLWDGQPVEFYTD